MEPSQKTAMPPIKKPLPALYAAGRVDPAQALLEVTAIFENASVGIFITRDSVVHRCNLRAAEIFGYSSPEELIGQPTAVIYPDVESFHRMGREAGPVLVTGRSFRTDWAFRKTDGTEVWCRVDGKPLDPQCTSAGTAWVIDDITERRRADQALHDSKAVLDDTLAYMDQGISLFDNDLKVLATNRRYFELLDFPESLAAPGTPFADFIRYNAQRGDYGPGDVEEQVRSRVEKAARFEPHHFERQRPDGTVIEVRGLPVPGRGFVTIYTDITKRAQAEQALRETQTELVATARQAGMAEIATNVLHNVGNILNSVNVSAGLISGTLRKSRVQGLTKAAQLMNDHAADLGDFLTRDDKGKMLPRYLSEIAQTLAQEQQAMLEELAHLTRSVDHIKAVVATQQSYAGRASIVEPVQMRELMEDALRINGDAQAHDRMTIVKEFAEVPVSRLDRGRVLQILVNLISNAKHAMEGVADRPRRMTLRLETAGPSLRVCVQDEGEGISATNLTRIFSHGFTTRKNGHGFGLHSCALAAGQMGGALTAHSDGPGKGATFTLELPIDGTRAAS
jgi:PAS domain S-box-containing protein